MNTRFLLLLSHGLCALGACAVAVAWSCGALWVAGTTLTVLACVVLTIAGAWSTRLTRGLRDIERTAATGELPASPTGGLHEIEATVRRVGECAQRWAETVANNREHARQFQILLGQLDRRAGASPPGSPVAQLRQLLAGIASALDVDLATVRGRSAELDQCTKELAASAEDQGDAVTKTTTYVEQLSTNFDAVTTNAQATNASVLEARESSRRALELARTLRQGIDQIHDQLEGSERRTSALVDRSHEIRSLVATISDLAARTDLLALNASIESLRAGEHGRGFAIVAEEVRKLAEQTTQASREAAGLADAAELETRESGGLLARCRAAALEETQRVDAANGALEQVVHKSEESALRVAEIARATQQQLQLTRDLVLAVERISGSAKAARSRAEKARWTAKSLGGAAQHLESAFAPLRRCLQVPGPRPAGLSAAVPANADDAEPSRGPCAEDTPTAAVADLWSQTAGQGCPTS